MNKRKKQAETAQRLSAHRASTIFARLTLISTTAALAALAAAAAQTAEAGVATDAAAARTLYRVVNLGPGNVGVAINALGQVTFSNIPREIANMEAWFYDGAQLKQLSSPGATGIITAGLNDAGQVTGRWRTANGAMHVFVWSSKGGFTDVGVLPGRNGSWDPVINNRGVVAGYSTVDPSPPYPHAFRWSASNGIEDLGLLRSGDDSSSYATAINDSGLIAGQAWAGGSNYHAFLWSRTAGMIDIDTLGNHASTPVAVSASGLVAGNLANPSDDNRPGAFWWTRAAGMHRFDPGAGLGSAVNSMASGGRVAGVITFPDYRRHAMTWTPEYGLHDLGTLGGESSGSSAANNKGQVVGISLIAGNTQSRAFLWTRQDAMVDLNRRLYQAPAGLILDSALAISDNGSIVARSNAGLVLLKPVKTCGCGHAVGPIAAPDMVQAGTSVATSIGFTTPDAAGPYKVQWTWGDGTAERSQTAAASKGGGSANARHSYAAAGIYTVTVDVADRSGHSARVSRQVVVRDAATGVVGGAGAVLVPATTGHPAPTPGGKASFSFVAAPTTMTSTARATGQFQFSLPGLSFASNDVAVTGTQAGRALLAGTGMLNGRGSYHFTATAAMASGDGKPGRFGIRISHADPASATEVVDYVIADEASGREGHPVVEGMIMVQ